MIYLRDQAINQINQLGLLKIPFFFFTDFIGSKSWIKPVSEIDAEELSYVFPNSSNQKNNTPFFKDITLNKKPKPLKEFSKLYKKVISEINFGNSFLVNLTLKTAIDSSLDLQEIFRVARAKYKIKYKEMFTVFSPETFVKIENDMIYSFPMKGTIDERIVNAENVIINDPKEIAEHNTIVDLIRNDLSQIANNVCVKRFRYIDRISTHEKILIQVSSEIQGKLSDGWSSKLGNIIFSLLPAGSVSGAPKTQTLRIIKEIEDYDRGYYTGVCGIFDGVSLDSAVMIRFIEKEGDQLYYKSGGGITAFSKMESEYLELLDKIYVPIY